MAFITEAILLMIVPAVSAQYGPSGRYNPDGNFDFGELGGGDFSPFGSSQSSINRQAVLIAHGVLAALAFVIFFPIGAIIIRLGSFRGAWLVHGLFQLFAYLVYITAFGIGIWMVNELPINLINRYHPIIGIVIFVLLFFQPILGFIHHRQYKKYSRRTIWSYGHIWLGRIAITLGMINGGLGMLLAKEAPSFLNLAPSRGQIIAYGVITGIMWLLWITAIFVGERRRNKTRNSAAERKAEVLPPPYKENHAYGSPILIDDAANNRVLDSVYMYES